MGILPAEVILQGILELQIPLGLRLPSFHSPPTPTNSNMKKLLLPT